MIGGDLVAKLTTSLLRYDRDGKPDPERFVRLGDDGTYCDYDLLHEEVYDGLSSGEKIIVDVAEVLDRADATLDDDHRRMVVDAAVELLVHTAEVARVRAVGEARQ